MKILSIDFDYFIEADASTRNSLFPYAEDADAPQVKRLWEEAYQKHPSLARIGLVKDYEKLLAALPSLAASCRSCTQAASHREIYEFILANCPLDAALELVNIDFHHDNYCMYGGTVTCANWLRKIIQKYPSAANRICWVQREDSETESLEGPFPYISTTNLRETLTDNYDLIFLCLSPEWTPPHLVPEYKKLAAILAASPSFTLTSESDKLLLKETN